MNSQADRTAASPSAPAPGIAIVIVAAGRGSRAGEGLPKQYREIGGKSVLRRTLEAFRGFTIQPVIHPDDAGLFSACSEGLVSILPPVAGGASRQESVKAGLEALAAAATPPDIVLVHDAARCFVSAQLVENVIRKVQETGDGALPALAVADTLKRAGEDNTVSETVPRDGLFSAQTPQAFPFTRLLDLHRRFAGKEMTDDAALYEAAGWPVHLVPGDPRNVKLTTREDFERKVFAMSGEPRTGTGFDVHRFGKGDHVWLCGVKIPHAQGLIGHSDADAAIHALVDALLGALSAGDIGDHFPPSDPQWRGAASSLFLEYARDFAAGKGARILHVDVTVICEAPRLSVFKPAMRARLAEILRIGEDRVSVKATTTEKLGFTGRSEGIAAQAVATLLAPGEMTS